MTPIIDLISDTVTQPTSAMRAAMARAVVGDEQRGEDPTTTALCERVAELLGKEAAVFMPSGVMCNQVSILIHCRPGDQVFVDQSAHIVNSEAGGPAVLAGATICPLPGRGGLFGVQEIEAKLGFVKRNTPRPRLIVVEQTVNRGGGGVWPLADIEALATYARAHDLRVHIDGARLMNAVVASGVAAREYARHCDTVWIDFSKGLGCPVGAVLAGSADHIEQAWIWKHRLGGAMRQSGTLAAAALHALDHHVERLAEDHANAQRLAAHAVRLAGIRLDPADVATNLVFFDVRGTGLTARQLCSRLLALGVRMGEESAYRVRAVTHLDISRNDVDEAAQALERVLAQR